MRANNIIFKLVAAFSLTVFILIAGLGIKMLVYPQTSILNTTAAKLGEKNDAVRIASNEDDAEELAAQKAEQEKAKAEKLAAQKAEQEKVEAEKLAAQKAEAEKLVSQKAGQEKAEAEKLAAQKAKEEKSNAEKLAASKQQSTETSNSSQTPAKSTIAVSALPQIPQKYNYKYLNNLETEVLKFVNIERQKAGIQPLIWDETLRASARYKANEMLQYNYFDHTSPYTGSPWDVAKKLGYSYVSFGENIYSSEGYAEADITAESIVASWMNSPGHKANILNVKFGKMGAGAVYSPDNETFYISQMFSN